MNAKPIRTSPMAARLTAALLLATSTSVIINVPAIHADPAAVEISDDGHERVVLSETPAGEEGSLLGGGVPYPATPDWENDVRRQVGGLQVADMNGDGWPDVVVGCYISDSYPPYDDWKNMIYFNVGGELESTASWISTDEVSTGDVQVAFINDDPYPDVFAANGGFSMSPSVIYWGGPGGPSTTPGWSSTEPMLAWNNYALPFDVDHDGDTDVITANQGNSPTDPYRPMYIFFNNGGTLATTPGWQSAETSIQNFLAMADYDHDGWEDLAVSKWANFASGIYKNASGSLQTSPVWTTGDTDTDKGVAWSDVNGDTWPDLALGHDPTQLWGNTSGSLSVVWTSGATFFGHSDIRFCDVDHDGDEDLAEVHFSDGKVHIYLNEGGVLSTAPSWTYDSPTVGTAIAFGDLNGDTWPDLVVGNSGQPCVKVFYAQVPTGVHDAGAETPAYPDGVASLQAAPNPFHETATLRYDLPRASSVRLAIYDTAGRLVRRLADGDVMRAGAHEIRWDGKDEGGSPVGTGVYYARLEAGTGGDSGRLLLLR